jgi:hypothetical protein
MSFESPCPGEDRTDDSEGALKPNPSVRRIVAELRGSYVGRYRVLITGILSDVVR